MDKEQIIDIHAHVFPDKIARKAASATGRYYGIDMHGDGTVAGLLENGEEIGVYRYIIHSTATKADQVIAVNDFIASAIKDDKRFIGFGTLHPDFSDIGSELDRIISFGFKGIKLHPDFQRFYIDSEKMLPIYRAVEGKLPILMHMGDERETFSQPRRLAKILDIYPNLTIIAAHLGGYMRWEESMDYLVGRDLYFDTSSTLPFMDDDRALEMIRAHGADRVMFGVDYPMWTHARELQRLEKLGLNEDELELILSKNAKNLLKI